MKIKLYLLAISAFLLFTFWCYYIDSGVAVVKF